MSETYKLQTLLVYDVWHISRPLFPAYNQKGAMNSAVTISI